MLVPLHISHKEMDKHNLFTKSLANYGLSWLMKKKQIGMNICLQLCFHLGLLTRWQQIIHPTS
jgi:hypothetical protein